jgi:hypothetical protein
MEAWWGGGLWVWVVLILLVMERLCSGYQHVTQQSHSTPNPFLQKDNNQTIHSIFFIQLPLIPITQHPLPISILRIRHHPHRQRRRKLSHPNQSLRICFLPTRFGAQPRAETHGCGCGEILKPGFVAALPDGPETVEFGVVHPEEGIVC